MPSLMLAYVFLYLYSDIGKAVANAITRNRCSVMLSQWLNLKFHNTSVKWIIQAHLGFAAAIVHAFSDCFPDDLVVLTCLFVMPGSFAHATQCRQEVINP